MVNQLTLEQQEYCKRLQDAGLIGWLAEATFATFSARDDWTEAETVWRRVLCYAKTVESGNCEKPFLILCGQVGNGKSHLAASVVHHFLDKGHRPAYFRVWPDYLKRIQATFRKSRSDDVYGSGVAASTTEEARETEEDIVSELQTGKVVVIDDLDKRRPTDWVREILFPVLNHRYNAGLPTILTLNYGPGDVDPVAPGRLALEAYLGRAGLDRVIGAAFDVIEFTGPSFRSGLDYQ
jgi:DNA replication protein DnaC